MSILRKKLKLKWDWPSLVVISTVIVAVIFLFKIIFWLSVIAVIAGIAWIIINFSNQEHDYTWIALVLIVGGLLLGSISYKIGYEFEQTNVGKPIVDTARSVVDTQNRIDQAQVKIIKETINKTTVITGVK